MVAVLPGLLAQNTFDQARPVRNYPGRSNHPPYTRSAKRMVQNDADAGCVFGSRTAPPRCRLRSRTGWRSFMK